MTLVELQSLAKRLGMPGFAAKQIASWLYDKKVASIDEMTNLSLKYRELLKQNYEVGAEAPVDEMRSVDGTVKYLYKVGENHFVESVYIPDDDRATLCVSSQVGCKMNCKFCMTGKQGYKANLTASQIINQILILLSSMFLFISLFRFLGCSSQWDLVLLNLIRKFQCIKRCLHLAHQVTFHFIR
jgi:23S rRNA (adenine2503-C2)-methyltransferase